MVSGGWKDASARRLPMRSASSEIVVKASDTETRERRGSFLPVITSLDLRLLRACLKSATSLGLTSALSLARDRKANFHRLWKPIREPQKESVSFSTKAKTLKNYAKRADFALDEDLNLGCDRGFLAISTVSDRLEWTRCDSDRAFSESTFYR